MSAIATLLLGFALQQPAPVPPPPMRETSDCGRPTYATEHLICDTPELLMAEQVLFERWQAARGQFATGPWIETQDAWFRRRAMCAFRPDHRACVEQANAERTAVLHVAEDRSPGERRLRCRGVGETTIQVGDGGTPVIVAREGGLITLAALPESPDWRPFVAFHIGEERRLTRIDGTVLHCR